MYYEFNVDEWIRSGRDPVGGTRRELYQNQWGGFRLTGIFSVADKWEYPWVSTYCNGALCYSTLYCTCTYIKCTCMSVCILCSVVFFLFFSTPTGIWDLV